jgi:murein DD-endopeptidase MepM/ murein hydrolase activator NlpD
MSSRKNTYKYTAFSMLVLCVLVPLGAGAVVDEETLATTKTELNDLWHAAAETTKRRSALEQTLAQFDAKVQNAKQDLSKASDQRRDVRIAIDQRLKLIEALQNQISTAQQTKDFYQGIAESRKQDFIDFVRYLVSKDIALRESGPSAGGDLLKRVLRQSLGEAIEQQMAQNAILQARQQFFSQVDLLLAESDRVGEQLHASAQELASEISTLEQKYGTISTVVLEKKAFIDDSWRVKKLTQDELAQVAKEAEESLSRISGMQASLMKVNDELKEQKVKALREEMDKLMSSLQSFEKTRDALLLKDKAMALLEENALQAYQNAMQAKGTDKKLYRHIEVAELQRSTLADDLAALKLATVETDPPVTDPAIEKLETSLAFLDRTIALMKDGVPQDLAEAYLYALQRGGSANAQRALLSQQIADVSVQVASASADVNAKEAEINAIGSQYSLSDVPPIFMWPVKGVITAGYLDADYVHVFHVPHRGLDIAVAQSSHVRSVSDGVVYAVHDGGLTGYSYIIVAHRNGYASLYGHVSAALVRHGDIVNVGQVIALSGGARGTRGAGRMTTGAHLHLEMMKNGKHIDPESLLPPR